MHVSLSPLAVVIDAYPNSSMVEQGTTLILVCRVVGVPSTTVLSYQWTCPGSYCDAGGVDPEWAARIQQDNILVVNVRRQDVDNGVCNCTALGGDGTQQVGAASYTLVVGSELWTLFSQSILKNKAHCIDAHSLCLIHQEILRLILYYGSGP